VGDGGFSEVLVWFNKNCSFDGLPRVGGLQSSSPPYVYIMQNWGFEMARKKSQVRKSKLGDTADDELYLAALEVERDEALAAEMAEWDVTVGDGLEMEG